MSIRRVGLLIVGVAAAGCTSFATVRPATVTPGQSFTMQASMATPPGDEAAWFFSFDCAEDCNRSIPAADLAYALGSVPATGARGLPFTVGLGLNGMYPYLEAYIQLARAPRTPFGLGVRSGVMGDWVQHQLYMRFEKRVKGDQKLLWNPGLFWHGGNSPNGENPGRMLAFVNGFGLELDATSPVAVIPSASIVLSRASRESYMERFAQTSLFATVGVSMTWRRAGP